MICDRCTDDLPCRSSLPPGVSPWGIYLRMTVCRACARLAVKAHRLYARERGFIPRFDPELVLFAETGFKFPREPVRAEVIGQWCRTRAIADLEAGRPS